MKAEAKTDQFGRQTARFGDGLCQYQEPTRFRQWATRFGGVCIERENRTESLKDICVITTMAGY
jgi:hypothetical protein